jgi:hypothetical protein
MFGKAFTVTVAFTIQPFVFLYVISVVPAETPVTNPVVLTVATAGVAETQGVVASGVAVPVNWVVALTHAVNVPLIAGKTFTVTVAFTIHPFVFLYVISVVPAETPVTNPVGLTVATAGVAETQGVVTSAVAVPANWVVVLTHAVNVPLIAGKAFTVTVAFTIQPFVFLYVISVVPAETPVTNPVLLTVATAGVAETQGVVPSGVAVPVNWVAALTHAVNVPLITGKAFTVTIAFTIQPFVFLYVISVVPAETPVTNPVGLTVATAGVAETQGVVASGVAVAVNWVVALTHAVNVPLIAGKAFTVTVALTIQPFVFLYVISVVPAETPVTNPVGLTVATAGVAETQGVVTSAVAVPANWVVVLTHAVNVPLIAGKALTVTVAFTIQPFVFLYVISVVPAETPVTNPVGLTVATAGVAEVQGVVASGVAVPVNWVVALTHAVNVPLIAGKAFTVTVAFTIQPFVFLYVISVVPAETPVTNPVLLTVATAGVAETQGVVPSGVAVPVNWVAALTHAVNVPLITGKAFTVTVAFTIQPFVFLYVISVVPAETPVTNPVGLTVATAGVAETQGVVASGVAVPVNWVVAPTQAFKVPLIIGNGLTVTTTAVLNKEITPRSTLST